MDSRSDRGKWSRIGRPIKGLVARAFENHLLTSYHRETFPKGEIIAKLIESKRKKRSREPEEKSKDQQTQELKQGKIKLEAESEQGIRKTKNLFRMCVTGGHSKLSPRQTRAMIISGNIAEGARYPFGYNLLSERSIANIQLFSAFVLRHVIMTKIESSFAITVCADSESAREEKVL